MLATPMISIDRIHNQMHASMKTRRVMDMFPYASNVTRKPYGTRPVNSRIALLDS